MTLYKSEMSAFKCSEHGEDSQFADPLCNIKRLYNPVEQFFWEIYLTTPENVKKAAPACLERLFAVLHGDIPIDHGTISQLN